MVCNSKILYLHLDAAQLGMWYALKAESHPNYSYATGLVTWPPVNRYPELGIKSLLIWH